MKKTAAVLALFAASFSFTALTGCAAPTAGDESFNASSSALDGPTAPPTDKPNPDLELALKYAGKADVIFVDFSESAELAKKLLEAGGALELEGGVAAQGLKGKLEGKFKADDLKELKIKTKRIIVVLKLGTGSDAAKELFKTLSGDIDKIAVEKGTAPKAEEEGAMDEGSGMAPGETDTDETASAEAPAPYDPFAVADDGFMATSPWL